MSALVTAAGSHIYETHKNSQALSEKHLKSFNLFSVLS